MTQDRFEAHAWETWRWQPFSVICDVDLRERSGGDFCGSRPVCCTPPGKGRDHAYGLCSRSKFVTVLRNLSVKLRQTGRSTA